MGSSWWEPIRHLTMQLPALAVHDTSCRTRRDIYYLRFIADFWEWICEYEYLQIFYVYCLLGHLFHFRYLWSIIPIFMILTYLNCIFGLDISVKLVMLDVSLPELNYATINRVCKWSTECWEVDQMSRLQLCSSIFVRFNLWLQRVAVQQWAARR